ncbi:threonine aldolase family protein [Marinigracilibium pacificum]|uniref:Aminotransferase class I/II-fold pyridoxal phosphate-dependent enzyme n=1 Tax=Marinigracilibium pacificum TaxID=2729599 RepID=A0A848J3Y7_9BACT|nr:aminotransferase class I/II-fold pyridoxal phosphate-dependent enzyme [Marinigracilibium pacificum]NMM47892.1 aminotransferase class I/II-fold pyridoxal phosphate-dependent enzyme [Marinigracilibium pacificum]
MDKNTNRRNFLKTFSLGSLPFILPGTITGNEFLDLNSDKDSKIINFFFDGIYFTPEMYINKLQEINSKLQIKGDTYFQGGITEILEQRFSEITGKEKSIFLPTGTMANQVAIKLLSGNNTKIIVPENSHIFRDEADAAQSVHGKRLIPVGKDKVFFNQSDLEEAINYTLTNEVFQSGMNTVVIENPIRRADSRAIPFEELKKITDYCRNKGYKIHLDGARIHIASAFTGISVKEYSSLFDTVYISLYKYLNAAGGAILSGPAEVIDKVKHQIKIFGGTMYQSWYLTAMANHYLNRLEERWDEVKRRSKLLINELNKINNITASSINNGTNIFDLKLPDKATADKLRAGLAENHSIYLRPADDNGLIKICVNESILEVDTEVIANAFNTEV